MGQKFVVKAMNSKNSDNDTTTTTFVGPTSGFYAFCRHPNYLGEVLFWFGLFVSGLPHYSASILSWITSSLGLYGIYGTMAGATKRLDGQQLEKYGGQETYDQWRANTFAMMPVMAR